MLAASIIPLLNHLGSRQRAVLGEKPFPDGYTGSRKPKSFTCTRRTVSSTATRRHGGAWRNGHRLARSAGRTLPRRISRRHQPRDALAWRGWEPLERQHHLRREPSRSRCGPVQAARLITGLALRERSTLLLAASLDEPSCQRVSATPISLEQPFVIGPGLPSPTGRSSICVTGLSSRVVLVMNASSAAGRSAGSSVS